MFRPRGSSPPRRLAPDDGRPAYCSRQPILGFVPPVKPRRPHLRITSSFRGVTLGPPERSPSRTARTAKRPLPPHRSPAGLRGCDLEALFRAEVRGVEAGVPDDDARCSPGLPLPDAWSMTHRAEARATWFGSSCGPSAGSTRGPRRPPRPMGMGGGRNPRAATTRHARPSWLTRQHAPCGSLNQRSARPCSGTDPSDGAHQVGPTRFGRRPRRPDAR